MANSKPWTSSLTAEVTATIFWSTAWVKAGLPGSKPVSCRAWDCTPLIQRSSTKVRAPPSGFVLVDRLLMSSR